MTMPTLLRLQLGPSGFRVMSLCAALALSACTAEGPPGPQGEAGPQGPQGPAGQPGAAGAGTLLRTSLEPAGANCEMAGSKLEVGQDANGNGTLDDAEVDAAQTRYVCNGAQGARGEPGPAGGPMGPAGPEGKRALVKTAAEAAGANCATGGIKLEAGVDADSNGTLDTAEVDWTLTRYVCNGAQGIQGIPGAKGDTGAKGDKGDTGATGAAGARALVKTSAEAAGANCATGGIKLEAGLDANGNNTLDTAEVDAALTRYVCTGAQGPQGIPGTKGDKGDTGATGAAGARSLVKTAAEAAGANCATGGIKFEAGVDANGNNTLDTAEVDAALTRYVCTGAQGPQGIPGTKGDKGDTGATGAAGARALVKTAAEAAGANCATGGVKLEAGVDANGNNTLDTAEVDAALTRYVCNGAKGDTGTAGGAGPQGPSGAVGLYGDGSAGALNVASGQTLDLTLAAGVASLPAGLNTQFSTITITGELIVPSGTLLRATGDITVNGKITVAPGVEDTGGGEAPQGVARTPASTYNGGQALSGLQAAQVLRPHVAGGGAGARLYAGDNANGGAGGGSLIIASGGNVRIVAGASITANGQSGTNPLTAGASILGTGGGAGGVVVVAAKGAITLAGTIQANGGNGADGFNGNGGTGEGGGGGGGGGIIHLLSSSAATITGSTVVNGGTAGNNAAPTTGTSITTAGGGGACGGNGGNGGGFIPGSTTIVNATAGQAGQVLKTVAAAPENLLIR